MDKKAPSLRPFPRGRWLACAAAAALAACGGGGGDDDARLSGVAATGAPISAGAVTVRCASGPVLTTTTAADGTWSVQFNGNQQLPCALQVAGGNLPGSTAYHSLATALGNVNITPLTDLIVARLAAADPATWFGAPVFAQVSDAAVAQARQAVASALGLASALGARDPVTAPFQATPGDALDKVLEAMRSALASIEASYAGLLAASISGDFSGFAGFPGAFTVSFGGTAGGGGTGGGAGGGAAGSLTVQVQVSGVAGPVVNIAGIPRPANQAEFCADVTDPNFGGSLSSVSSGAAGSFTVQSCAFSGNRGEVRALLSVQTPVALTLPYVVTYTYN